MNPAYGVRQYIGVVRAHDTGLRFRVCNSGDPHYYVFDLLIGESSASAGVIFPVLKKNLRREIRSALAHGWGNSL